MAKTGSLLETPLEAERVGWSITHFSLLPRCQSPTRASHWLNLQKTRVQGSLGNVVNRARPRAQSRAGEKGWIDNK